MNRKEIAMAFLQNAGMGNVREAYSRYIAHDFIHHNQYFKGDRDSLLVAMEEASRTSPNKSVDIKHVYEDGDTVITHSFVQRVEVGAPGIAVVHIFRFGGDKIVELWDLGMLIEKNSPNENGLF